PLSGLCFAGEDRLAAGEIERELVDGSETPRSSHVYPSLPCWVAVDVRMFRVLDASGADPDAPGSVASGEDGGDVHEDLVARDQAAVVQFEGIGARQAEHLAVETGVREIG